MPSADERVSDNEDSKNQGVGSSINNEAGNLNDQHHREFETECDRFDTAQACRCKQAAIMDAACPRLILKSTWKDIYVYSIFEILLDKLAEQCFFLLPQMSVKAVLKLLGDKGAAAIMKELGQLIIMDVISRCFAHLYSTKTESTMVPHVSQGEKMQDQRARMCQWL
jgi:hypothetical protein